jgi:hypothetical protein
MTSITNFDIQKHNDETKKSIKNLDKPLSSFNYYIKEMRENWGNLSEEEKDKYILKSKADNQRYSNEKQEILDKSKEEIKKLKIFLSYSGDRVPCVGLDNGFTSYTIIGPIDNVELFIEEEKKKLIEKGVPEKYIGKYKSINGIKFNWRAAKKWDVTVYGGSIRGGWGGLRENYQGKAGKFTTYTNYKGETWTESY